MRRDAPGVARGRMETVEGEREENGRGRVSIGKFGSGGGERMFRRSSAFVSSPRARLSENEAWFKHL